ncbi:hypothetical protein BN1708_016032 [Verticillium longisporum]|uniref:adenine phosphoribosyltransferase n=1 Tax=Verticillium longisporum TaxID=100787 RepID=A0A0G4MC87_VERLO|nr:hypothetical protein BN1708_016032 [Verticillium longisporum]
MTYFLRTPTPLARPSCSHAVWPPRIMTRLSGRWRGMPPGRAVDVTAVDGVVVVVVDVAEAVLVRVADDDDEAERGKLPGPCVTAEYQKEYGTDFFQMQEDAIKPGQKVLIVDDIIATGGSAKAAADLVKKLGGEIMGFLFILEIPGLNGREKLDGINTTILIEDA